MALFWQDPGNIWFVALTYGVFIAICQVIQPGGYGKLPAELLAMTNVNVKFDEKQTNQLSTSWSFPAL